MLYVQASLLALHVDAGPQSRVEGWVRINTPVEVLAEDGEMVQVRLLDRPEQHGLTGWVKGSYLDTDRLSVGDTWDGVIRARLAEDAEAEAMWLERTLAINPLYSPARTEPPPQEAWLAVCQSASDAQGRLELLGRVSEAGFEPDFHFDPARGRALSAQHWLRLGPGTQREVIEGSPFAKPFGTEQWNASHRSAWEPATCEGICEEQFQVTVLGACEDIGALYASSPVVETHHESSSRVRMGDEEGLFELYVGGARMSTPVTWWNAETGDPPVEPGYRWIRVGEARYAVVEQGSYDWGGFLIFRVREATLEIDSVQLHGSGC